MSNRASVKGPSIRRPGSDASDDDAFVAGAIEVSSWAETHRTTLIAVVVAIGVAVAGGLYWNSSRAAADAAAIGELEGIAQIVAFGDTQTAVSSLEAYLARYGSTRYALEARIVLAQLHLSTGDAALAIEALRPAARDLSEPLGVQAALLMAVAFENQENWAEAERTYLDVSRSQALDFQVRDALADAARVRVEQGNVSGAIELYRQLIDRAEADDPARGIFEMRLAELTAQG